MHQNQPHGKKSYESPQLKEWGSVEDLTQTGMTSPGNDAKGGSAASQGR